MARSVIFASFLLLALLILLCWFPMPLSADITFSSISQQVSVSGYAQACDPLCQGGLPPDVGQSFSPPLQINTKLPATNLSVSGSATDNYLYPFPLFTRTASSSADASQSSTVTGSDIQADLNVDSTLSGGYLTLVDADAAASSQYSLTFDLPSAYLVHLTGFFEGSVQGYDFGANPFGVNGLIHFSGPGSPPDQVFPASAYGPYEPIDTTFALGPGTYTLDASAGLSTDGAYSFDYTLQIETNFNASFTAIPEPTWMPVIFGALVLVAVPLARRTTFPHQRRISMTRSTIFASFLILCLFQIPLGADVVPISISQQVSVSGNATACDFGCGMGYGLYDAGQSFSPPTQTSTQLPPVNLSISGSATDSALVFGVGRAMSASGNVGTSSTLTGSSIQLDIAGSGQLEADTDLTTGYVNASGNYLLDFQVTNPSLVHLTGYIEWLEITGDYGSLYAWADEEIHLTGPGVNFNQVDTTGDPSQLFDLSFILYPGVNYTLNALSSFYAMGSDFPQDYLYGEVSLNADFTSCIPEPARVSLVLDLVMLASAGLRQAANH